jgi:hypothetical protein
MSTSPKLFLDLEDTIIKSWDNPTLINVDAIREWIDQSFETDDVTISIFSFAIWNEKDKADFVSRGTRAAIEKALNVEVTEWLSVEEMQQIIEEWSGFRYVDRTDFMQLHGKHDAFIKVCLAREEKTTCVLIDDAVPHRTVIDHARELTIDLLPVQMLTKQPLEYVQTIL